MMGGLAVRKNVGTPLALKAASTNITSAAYVELEDAATAPASAIRGTNTTAQPIAIAIGAAGAEVQKFVLAPGAYNHLIPCEVKNGARISAKSLDATANTGYLTLDYLA